MTCFQAVISNSASCDDIALTPDGLDADGSTRLGRKKEKEGIKAEKQKQIQVVSNA